MTEMHGSCDEQFAPVRDAFARNFEQGLDVGASVAVTVDGEFVVDLWAGHADEERTRPWERDTIINVWSTTKTMTALCALVLADRGELDFDVAGIEVLAGVRRRREGRCRGPPPHEPHRRVAGLEPRR